MSMTATTHPRKSAIYTRVPPPATKAKTWPTSQMNSGSSLPHKVGRSGMNTKTRIPARRRTGGSSTP